MGFKIGHGSQHFMNCKIPSEVWGESGDKSKPVGWY
jgi:hypothetical protein